MCLSGASIRAFREETGRGLHLQLPSLACPAPGPCLTLPQRGARSFILTPNLAAGRFGLCVTTPSPFPLQASGLLYVDESLSLCSLLLLGT